MQTCFFWPTHSVDLEFWIYTEKDVDENPGMTEYGRNDEWRRLLTTAAAGPHNSWYREGRNNDSLVRCGELNKKTIRCWDSSLVLYKKRPKLKADIALPGNPISELWDVTCHMGSQWCYLPPDTSERAPPNRSHAGWYSIYLPRRDGRLSWVDLVDLIAPWPGVEPATFRSRVRRRTAAHICCKKPINLKPFF